MIPIADRIQDTFEYQGLNENQKKLIDNLPSHGSLADIETLKGIIQEFSKSSSNDMMFYRTELRVLLSTWENDNAHPSWGFLKGCD